jgi:PAS domain S-box-containing protein
MVVVNQGGEIVLLNAQAEKQFGYRRDELLGQKVKNIIPEGFAERLIADGTRSAAEALAQQIGTGIELLGRRKDGSEFPIEIMLSPLESAQGILVTAAIRNISVRQASEKRLAQMEHRRQLGEDALRESEERYRMLLDGVRDYAIFMMDPEGRIVSWNAGAERIKGYTADQIIGHNFSCFFLPEDIERGRPLEVLRQTAASGRHEEQGMRVRQNGSRFLASTTLTALRGPNGNLRGFSEFSHDLSERKASEAKYRGLLEAAPDAMVVVSQSGEIVLLNAQAEKQFGYSRDELLGLKVKNIIPEGFAERLIADGTRSAAEALAQQIGTGLELSGRRKDGSEFPIEIMLSPLESAEGILVTAAIRNISVRKDAEQHLAQMEGRYRGLLEAAPDAMVVVNQGGEIVLLNAQAEKQFGYRRNELLGQKVKNIIPEGFAERLIADGTRSAAEALAQQIGTGIEISGRRKDGTEFPIEIMLSPLESAEGILVTAAIRNISVRKDAEKRMALIDDRYRGLLETAADAMVVSDSRGQILLINAETERVFGYSREELIGQTIEVLIPEAFRKGHPQHRQDYNAHPRTRLIGESLELRGLRKDRTEFPIEIMLSPMKSAEGTLVTAAIRDITERKRAEEALRRSEEGYRLILSNVKDYAMFMLDTTGVVVTWNDGAEKMKGFVADEIIGQNFSRFYTAEDMRDEKPAFGLEQAAKHQRYEVEGWRVRKDGSRFFADVVITALHDQTGRLRGFGKITRDITERKKADERMTKTVAELKRSNDELQQFAYVASHDLQEPLRMVASYTQLLAKRYQGRLDSDADEFIAFAVDGCSRMRGLIQDLLTYSRAGARGKSLVETSAEDTLQEALVNLSATIEQSGAVVTHDSLPVILADGNQLVQVFQNLVGNAIKYRGTEVPRIHVSASKNGSPEWIFSVRDNGLGIDPKYFERVFVLFQRLHLQTEFEGTGIGLAVCKKIVERLGGRIWVESQLGQGSTFYFALPEKNETGRDRRP